MRWVHVLTGFSGRIGRGTFWIGMLILMLILIAGMFGFAGLMRPTGATQVELFVVYALLLVAFWVSVALIVKRLHDRGKSALWYPLFGLGPLIAYWLGEEFSSNISNVLSPAQQGFWLLSLGLWLWAIVELGLMPGTMGPNRFGPDVRGKPDAGLKAPESAA
ncbi:MAG: DUF805 domain-containing protein [Methyloceanibacter sp.]|uniref:DUF805 domain-containing protein n=1 Tax=Methyloceanibacter sp. TaxID=1965321 RepID=UPI003D6C9FB2